MAVPRKDALAERLERGEVIHYPTAPFPLPEGAERALLLEMRLAPFSKNISYDPARDKAHGFLQTSVLQAEAARAVFARFSREATAWLACMLPRYAAQWKLDRGSYRPEEEATRRLRLIARNDLLHVDAFPNRPTQGHRILRVFANINPTEPRVWVTSEPFAKLLERYGPASGLPGTRHPGWLKQLGKRLLRALRPGQPRQSAYDRFMLRFHDYLKMNEEFQERTPKRLWDFAPGAVWLAMTDACSHAVLRGRFALEHSYFIPPEALAVPDESPAALLQKACSGKTLSQAA
jgi:3-deoxy-D-manno-octulosonic acid hydroxylase-like protein